MGTSCFAGPGSTFAAGWHNLGEGNAADTAESRRVAAVPDAAKLNPSEASHDRRQAGATTRSPVSSSCGGGGGGGGRASSPA